MATTQTEIHVTRISDGSVYGHETSHCDAGGCAAGADGYWSNLNPEDVTVGDVVDLEVTTTQTTPDAMDSILARRHEQLATAPATLDHLLEAIRAGRYDEPTEDAPAGDQWDGQNTMTSLPTFGGEPHGAAGVWSWDEARLLIGTGRDDMRIVSRDD